MRTLRKTSNINWTFYYNSRLRIILLPLLSSGLLTHEHTDLKKYVPGGQVLGSGSPSGLLMINIVSVSGWISRGQSGTRIYKFTLFILYIRYKSKLYVTEVKLALFTLKILNYV